MSDWDGHSRGNTLGYKIFIFILKYIHIRVAYFVVVFVVFYFYIFSKKTHIRFFYRQIIAHGKLKSELSIYRNYLFLGKTIIDRVALIAGFSNKFTYDFEGENYLQQMADEGKGGIILGAHTGNWEIAGHLLTRLNRPVHLLMFDGERSKIKEVLEEVTGNKGFKVIYIRQNDLSHIFQISEALKDGDLIAMHGDRFIPGSKTHLCSFFGRKAMFPVGPYILAAHFAVPVCFVSTMKDSDTHYHFYATAPVTIDVMNEKERNSKIEKNVELYATELEKMVKKYPLQWFNYYNFWQTN
jgi:predicted LPLAT superfamily acyltransferase